jgi:hypothetical protein
MIDSLSYCVGNEVYGYLVVDLSQASTSTNTTRYRAGASLKGLGRVVPML